MNNLQNPVAGAFQLFGVNPFLTEEQAREIRQVVDAEREVLAGLDEEIARAMKQLDALKRQRNAIVQLIHSNSAPSDAQTAEIRQEILQLESNLDVYEAEMSSVQNEIDTLIEQRDRLGTEEHEDLDQMAAEQERLNTDIERRRASLRELTADRAKIADALEAQRSILSPIRRIPVEIIAEILLYTLPDTDYVLPAPMTSPILISQVCQGWRTLSHSIPRLWSSILIRINSRRSHPNLGLVELWLQRSSNSPISFHISEDVDFDEIKEDANTHILSIHYLQVFIPFYDRWQNVRIDQQDWRIPSGLSLPTFPQYPPPMLKSLALSRDFWIGDDSGYLRQILSSPNLEKLIWRCRHSALRATEVVSLSQMVHLDMTHYIRKKHLLSVLSEAPNLVSCRFSVVPEDDDSPSGETASSNHVISLQKLRSLQLHVAGSVQGIMDYLTLPSLESIEITKISPHLFAVAPGYPRFWDHEKFMTMLQRSRCRIHTLKFTGVDFLPQELVGLLTAVSPTLLSLAIMDDGGRGSSVTDDVLRALTPHCNVLSDPNSDDKETEARTDMSSTTENERNCLCPNLGHIKLWGCVDSTDGLLGDLMESRWAPNVNRGPCRQLAMAMVMLKPLPFHEQDAKKLKQLNATRTGITVLRHAGH
jgi:hypothetical protein